MLREYRAKRDFDHTPEPAGKGGSKQASGRESSKVGEGTSKEAPAARARTRMRAHARGGVRKETTAPRAPAAQPARAAAPRFVVHEHHARRLHWDLRLEHDGALLSWAVPNGIPQDPSENRKAVHVEDHPLEYLDFEGDIPAREYGAGHIGIWDRGTYEAEKVEDGKLVVVFDGARLRGRYALFRAGGEERDWMIHRMDPPERPREPMPEHVRPMLATAGELPRREAGWALEIKWDGVRAIAYSKPGRWRLESRNLKEITSRYPELRALGRELASREAVLDGEIVAFDERGAPSFERLQDRMHLTSESAIRRLSHAAPVTYVIFDVLHLDGVTTIELPYRERRELLQRLQLDGPSWQTPAYREGDGRALLAATAEHGLEGLLAKRLDAPYREGERSAQWLKIKNTTRQELVIGGWLPGKGNREGRIGALLMGYHESEDKRRALRYAGRVGTGFDESELARLARELKPLARRASPFSKSGVQPPRESRFVEPRLVAEVQFSHWTRDRILRHSVYRGLRADKSAAEVEREVPLSASAVAAASARPSASKGAGARRGSGGGSAGRDEGARRRATSRTRAAPVSAELPYAVTREMKHHTEIEVEGVTLRLSNRDKVLYPQTGFTKGDLIDYYARIGPIVLGHLRGRPLTLKRYPDGVEGQHFYEKRCPSHRPEWVRTAPIWSERQSEPIDYCVVEDLATLIWLANLADVELHPSLSLAQDPETPTALVFDLDPGAPAGLRECARVALRIRELFDALHLRALAKTSGSKGMQVHVPLNTAVSYEETKQFARAVAELLQKLHPDLVTARMTKSARPGKVLIDWSQNDPHKTTVCVYSPRAVERPLVSTPLRWEEVERAAHSRRRELQLSLQPHELLGRVAREGDLHEELLTLRQALPDFSGAAGEGGSRTGRPGPRGRTREQLYQEARDLGIEGRSGMNKAELQRAVDSRKRA